MNERRLGWGSISHAGSLLPGQQTLFTAQRCDPTTRYLYIAFVSDLTAPTVIFSTQWLWLCQEYGTSVVYSYARCEHASKQPTNHEVIYTKQNAARERNQPRL